jgi:hypothetical protein
MSSLEGSNSLCVWRPSLRILIEDIGQDHQRHSAAVTDPPSKPKNKDNERINKFID